MTVLTEESELTHSNSFSSEAFMVLHLVVLMKSDGSCVKNENDDEQRAIQVLHTFSLPHNWEVAVGSRYDCRFQMLFDDLTSTLFEAY